MNDGSLFAWTVLVIYITLLGFGL